MIWKGLSKYRDWGLLILRVGIGTAMILHGIPKLSRPDEWKMYGSVMGHLGIHFLPAVWGFLAGAVETSGGLLLTLGLFFRPACILLVLQMCMAMVFHLTNPVPLLRTFQAGYSHALELLIVFLGLLLIGPGKYSIDRG